MTSYTGDCASQRDKTFMETLAGKLLDTDGGRDFYQGFLMASYQDLCKREEDLREQVRHVEMLCASTRGYINQLHKLLAEPP